MSNKDEYTGPYAQGEPYAKVVYKPFAKGDLCQEREPHQPKNVWQIDIDNFNEALKVIDPRAYFTTSGEAVRKAERLHEDLKAMLAVVGRMKKIFVALKADAKYLETQWENERLLLKQKNPRPSSRMSMRTLQNEQTKAKAAKSKSKSKSKSKPKK
jgi:hypothetical protein